MYMNAKLKYIRNFMIYMVVVSMLLISSGVAGAEDAQAVPPSEESMVAAGLMEALGITNAIPADMEKTVTNGQFAQTLLSILGYPAIDGERAAAAAKEMKLILDGKLTGDGALKWTTAMQMAVSVTGYNVKAVAQGSGMEGYYSLAGSLGLNQGIKAGRQESLNAADALRLVYNILHTDIMKQSYGSGSEYTVTKDVTILTEKYDIALVKGVVTAVDYTSLYTGELAAGDNRIQIGTTVYICEDAQEMRQYLGCYVQAYVGGADDDQLYYLYPTKNQETSIIKDDVDQLETGTISYYQENGRLKSLRLDSAYDVVYNGKPYGGSDWLEIAGAGAVLRLIDNDRDNTYEVIMVSDPRYVLISSVDLVNKVLYGSKAEQIDLGKTDGEVMITDSKGTVLSINEISKNSLLKAVVSKDGLYIRLLVCADSIQGTVTRADSKMEFLEIDGVRYLVDPYFKENTDVIPQGGRSYTFWISEEGKIVRAQDGSTIMRYGYVMNSYTGDDGEPYVRVLDQSGKILPLKFKSSVVLDGRGTTATVAAAAVSTEQLVRFRYNKDEILVLDTAQTSVDFVDPDTAPDNNNLTAFQSNESLQYKSASKMFGTAYGAGSAIVFVVPKEEEHKGSEYYKVSTSTAFSNDRSYQQGSLVTAYNIEEDRNAQAIVYYNSTGVTSSYGTETENAVVEELTQELNRDEELCYYISYVMNNQFFKLPVDEEVSILKTSGNLIDTGDVIRFSVEENTIKSLVVDFDAEYGKMEKDGKSDAGFNGTSQILQYHYGMTYSINGGAIMLTQPEVKDASDGDAFQWKNTRLLAIPSGTALLVERVYRKNADGTYSMKNQEIRRIEQAEVRTYKNSGAQADFALIRQRYMEAKSFIIYRNIVE